MERCGRFLILGALPLLSGAIPFGSEFQKGGGCLGPRPTRPAPDHSPDESGDKMVGTQGAPDEVSDEELKEAFAIIEKVRIDLLRQIGGSVEIQLQRDPHVDNLPTSAALAHCIATPQSYLSVGFQGESDARQVASFVRDRLEAFARSRDFDVLQFSDQGRRASRFVPNGVITCTSSIAHLKRMERKPGAK